MKQELNDIQVEEVRGGTVVLSRPLGLCGFSTLSQSYRIKGEFKNLRNRMLDLFDEYGETMSAEEFDILVRDDFLAKGWI